MLLSTIGLFLLCNFCVSTLAGQSSNTQPRDLGYEAVESHRLPVVQVDLSNVTSVGPSGSVCSSRSILNGNSGELTSPNYPGNYPNNVSCVWRIRPPKDRHVYLFFHEFELEEGFVNAAFSRFAGSECHFDLLYIAEEYDSSELHHEGTPERGTNEDAAGGDDMKNNRVSWGVFCGANMPPPRITERPGSIIVLQFRSDNSETRPGFYASFHSVASKNSRQGAESREATPSESMSGFFSALWALGSDESARAYLAVIVFVSAVIAVIATAHCYSGRPNCNAVSRWRRRARSSGSIPSLVLNMFGGSSRETLRTPTPPPEYGEIVKTEEDWKEALERMGETDESMERYRSLPNNIQIVYNLAEPHEQHTATEPRQRSPFIPRELPMIERMSDPRGGVSDNFFEDVESPMQPRPPRRIRSGPINSRRSKIIATIGRNDQQSSA